MPQLFDRRVKLDIGTEPKSGDLTASTVTALEVTGLRVQFRIEKSLRPEPQKAQVAIWNLSESSRGAVVGKGLLLRLEAGYSDTLALIYQGHTRTTDHQKQATDWVTKFECGTAERAIQFARVSQSFSPGALISDAAKELVRAISKDTKTAEQRLAQLAEKFASGYASHGNAAAELTRLLSPLGLTWSVQDDRMQILGKDEALPGQAVVLDEDHGLIGTPELGSPVIKGGPSLLKIRSLLDARFSPGCLVQLDSTSRKGTFKVVNLVHVGDTHGGEWYTELEAVPHT